MLKKVKITFIIISTFLATYAQNSPIWRGLEKGIHDIGFTTINISDNSRQVEVDSAEIARPIQISMWYPSHKGENKMSLNTYYVNYAIYRNFKKNQPIL